MCDIQTFHSVQHCEEPSNSAGILSRWQEGEGGEQSMQQAVAKARSHVWVYHLLTLSVIRKSKIYKNSKNKNFIPCLCQTLECSKCSIQATLVDFS